ncbi:hypothetical protein J2T07_001458 [Luteibacter jiangsuensis]|uniref:DUF4279 domain-containing protein n=1 Tax=Luteibacter jiangsuensis TaxID=637577 RepID=A0ABT9SWA2_9GAMM|nr:DUF4279 domain-containing protein [Luteibacter jiangsuensis]MDQ0009281.1 hypothetical protein [Luteibacter jiangsuensis]
METWESNSLLQATLYVKGADLEVDQVSVLLGVPPTNIYRKGEPKIRGRDRPVYATNTWKLSLKRQSLDVSAILLELLAMLKPKVDPVKIQGADDVFIDIFMASTVEAGNLGASIEWQLTTDALHALNRFGLPVRFSVCNVEP